MTQALDFMIPDYDWIMFGISVILLTLLGFISYTKKVLDLRGSALAVVVGLIIIGYSDFFWFLLILFFFAITYIVTKWKYNEKEDLGLSEGKIGERGFRNVLANGIIPVSIAFLSGPLNDISEGLAGFLFVVSIAIAASDTFGSEVGVISKKPRLITRPRMVVQPGVDGGVSVLGTSAAFFGSLLISVAGYFLVTDFFLASPPHYNTSNLWIVLIPTLLGWLGCQVDSILGATLQRRGMLTNNLVNFITILACIIVIASLFVIIS